MIEIRFHGRGGTGSVLASQALAKAVFYSGKHAVTFPSFGAERRGAPVLAFTRINEKRIFKRTQIYEPDLIVVLDNSLLELIDVADGLKPNGIGILNSDKKPEDIVLSKSINAGVVNATKISEELLDQPITNSAMLGALIRALDVISFSDLEKGILSVFTPKIGEKQAKKNVEAAKRAYEETIFGKTKDGRTYEKNQPWLPTIDELPIGTIIPKMIVNSGRLIGPGSAKTKMTGTWSHYKAEINQEKCIQCFQCMFHCPEGTIVRNEGKLIVNKSYCKACGICRAICPVNAIKLIKIEEFSEIMK